MQLFNTYFKVIHYFYFLQKQLFCLNISDELLKVNCTATLCHCTCISGLWATLIFLQYQKNNFRS